MENWRRVKLSQPRDAKDIKNHPISSVAELVNSIEEGQKQTKTICGQRFLSAQIRGAMRESLNRALISSIWG